MTSKDAEISETVQALRRIFKTIQDYSQEVSGTFGITGPQLWVLKTIAQGKVLPLGELSQQMFLHPSTVTGVVDRLEAKGYLERVRDVEDRRVAKVRLTESGKKLVKKAPNPAQGKLIYGLKRLNKEQVHRIFDAVKQLVEIMEAEHVKATFFFEKE